MKNNLKKSITRILACALLIATLGLSLASCTAGDKVKDTVGKAWDTAVDGAEKIYDAAKDKITMEQTDDLGQISLLSLYTGTEPGDEQDVMIQVIKATVLPESATDQSTTWEVYWLDNQTGNEDAAVTDYVTVMACIGDQPYTAQPGANYCKVTCKQPFAGSTIGVRVTTVVGGFVAECKVTYEGVPTYLGFHEVLAGGGYRFVDDQPLLNIGTTDFVLALDNPLHGVGADFGRYEIVSTGYSGKCGLYIDGAGFTRLNISVTCNNGSIACTVDGKDYNVTSSDELYPVFKLDNFITTEIADGTLRIVASNAFDGFVVTSNGKLNEVLKSMEDDPIVFYVTVKDTVSGVSNTLKFRISDVSSVTLSDSNLAF